MSNLKVIIYFDYELQQGADMCSVKQSWGLDDYDNTNLLLEYLSNSNIKVCFATVGRIGKDDKLPYGAKKQIQAIVNQGHEIASHSMYHHQFDFFNEKNFVKDLKDSKKILEDVTGEKIVTYVPPRNLPYNFLNFGVTLFRFNKFNIPFFSKWSLNKLYSLILDSGFDVYREYNYIFNKNFIGIKNLKVKSKLKSTVGVNVGSKNSKFIINKLNFSGFSQDSQDFIIRNKDKNVVVTVYGHPHSLTTNSLQSFENFKLFCDFLIENDIDVILPRELI